MHLLIFTLLPLLLLLLNSSHRVCLVCDKHLTWIKKWILLLYKFVSMARYPPTHQHTPIHTNTHLFVLHFLSAPYLSTITRKCTMLLSGDSDKISLSLPMEMEQRPLYIVNVSCLSIHNVYDVQFGRASRIPNLSHTFTMYITLLRFFIICCPDRIKPFHFSLFGRCVFFIRFIFVFSGETLFFLLISESEWVVKKMRTTLGFGTIYMHFQTDSDPMRTANDSIIINYKWHRAISGHRLKIGWICRLFRTRIENKSRLSAEFASARF